MYRGLLGFRGSWSQVHAVFFSMPGDSSVAGMRSKRLLNGAVFAGLVINENLCLIPCRPVRLHIVLH